MENDNVFEHLQKLFEDFKGNLNIINEKIDIEIQMAYFKQSEEAKKDLDPEKILNDKDLLFNNDTHLDIKKDLLNKLASVEDVVAFRTIEKYLQAPDAELKNWALLALQESKMLLQSKFLDQNQIFISTGLGGHDNMLRYFIVLLAQNNESFSDFQQDRIKREFTYIFQRQNSVIEEFNFAENIATITALIPIEIKLSGLFTQAVAECNQYGNFIKDNGIITNVKILSTAEIKDFLKNKPDDISEISEQKT